ncbi:hypothetical protein WBJ53_14960 [Spirosoma sp. SC4-14]|uniref:hypothetical protein n=1 Tax=Spirosoma sp. SC4-14 TaxID=3128900 RepID=UPI0030CC8EDB
MADYGTFTLNALRPNGTGVYDAQVRILNASLVDVTSVLFGVASGRTDSSGNVTKWLTSTDHLEFGQTYTIQVIAHGFELWETETSTAFNGNGQFTANLIPLPASTDYTITEPADGPLSSMEPIICLVTSPNDFDFEYINAIVEHPDGKVSISQGIVDKAELTATIDIRNRVTLGVRPLLVSAPAHTREDTEFSTKVDVTFSSISPEAETPIPGSFSRLVAHTESPEGETDLSSYASLSNQRWIVPAEPVIAFRGYYRDVMFWLTAPSLSGYILAATFYDADGQVVNTTTTDLVESDYVQRYQIDTNPADTVVKAVLVILSGESPITKQLTVLYRD